MSYKHRWPENMFKVCQYFKIRPKYRVGKKGKLLVRGIWTDFSVVFQEIAEKRKREEFVYKERQEKRNQVTKNWRSKNVERVRERNRRYREAHKEFFRRAASQWKRNNPERVKAQRRAFYVANNPTAGLRDALSQFRSGAIGIDELNRRYDEAIKRADEIVSNASKGKRKPV